MVDTYLPEQMAFHPLPYRYIMDSCSILSQKPDEPHRRGVYHTLWQKIEEYIEAKIIVICSEIKAEVEDKDINLWLQKCGCEIIVADEIVQNNVAIIVNQHPQLLDFTNAKSSGDAFLIATAMKYQIAVITEENKLSHKKIPKICQAYNIPCYNLTELAEKEKWKF